MHIKIKRELNVPKKARISSLKPGETFFFSSTSKSPLVVIQEGKVDCGVMCFDLYRGCEVFHDADTDVYLADCTLTCRMVMEVSEEK